MANIILIISKMVALIGILFVAWNEEKYVIKGIGTSNPEWLVGVIVVMLVISFWVSVIRYVNPERKLAVVDLVLNLISMLICGGLGILGYKIWLLESSDINVIVLGLLGLVIMRKWSSSEKIDLIERCWNLENNKLAQELIVRFNKEGSWVGLPEETKSMLLQLDNPVEIKNLISGFFVVVRKQKISEMSLSESWVNTIWWLGNGLYNFVMSPWGLFCLGGVLVLVYLGYKSSFFGWFGTTDHKHATLVELKDALENTITETSVISERVNHVVSEVNKGGLYLNEEINKVSGESLSMVTTVSKILNSNKESIDKMGEVTSLVEKEEAEVGLLRELLSSSNSKHLVSLLLNTEILKELEILYQIQQSHVFGESFFNKLAEMLQRSGYVEKEFLEGVSKTVEKFPGEGKSLKK